MLKQAGARFGNRRLKKDVPLAGPEARSLEERDRFIENGPLPGNLDILCRDIGEPDAVVRHARAYAAAGFWQPPMLHIAFGKLARSRAQNMPAGNVRFHDRKRSRILKLIAEAISAARLIEARTRPDPTR